MTDSVVNNGRIAKNTIILYCRMIVTTFISIYTVRVILDVLGVVDYGIYNVVGSVVAFASFLNGSMTAASNRSFAVAIVNKDSPELSKMFSINIIVFSTMLVLLVVLLESIGGWYLNSKMIIPQDRLIAANWVFHTSVVAFALSIISVPYTSMVIIHEKMSVFAYISLFDSVSRLLMALLLPFVNFDKLVTYGIFQCVISLCSTILYVIYCRFKYKESKFRWFWSKEKFIGLFSFTSYYFLGTTSVVLKSQGVNILINAFFNTVVNAARGIAFQVESAVLRFSDSFFTAVKPQIYLAYANKEFDNLIKLIFRTTILCSFLMIVLSLPLALNANIVLSVWLKDVPQHTELFLKLILIDGVINAVSNPVILSLIASGNIKSYQIAEFVLRVITLPICYVALLIGNEPEITAVVAIMTSIGSYLMRAYMLKRELRIFPIRKYLFLTLKIVIVTAGIYFFVSITSKYIGNQFVFFIYSCFTSVFLFIVMLFYLIIPIEDRKVFLSNIKKHIRK